jgi:flagellin
MSLSVSSNVSNLSVLRSLQLQPLTSRRFLEISGGRNPLTVSNPAGLVISQTLQAQLRRINQAQENLEMGVSYAQTAEGGVSSIQEDLQRMRELAVQASNGTLSDEDRAAINTELKELKENIDQTVTDTTFNGTQVLATEEDVVVDGSAGPRISVPGQGTEIQASLDGLDTALTTFDGNLTADEAGNLVDQIDENLNDMSSVRSTYAAAANRFTSTARSLDSAGENTAAAESRIADADMAIAAAQMTIARIFSESNLALLAQGNVNGGMALNLLASPLLTIPRFGT